MTIPRRHDPLVEHGRFYKLRESGQRRVVVTAEGGSQVGVELLARARQPRQDRIRRLVEVYDAFGEEEQAHSASLDLDAHPPSQTKPHASLVRLGVDLFFSLCK